MLWSWFIRMLTVHTYSYAHLVAVVLRVVLLIGASQQCMHDPCFCCATADA
jgi:hypothetical protein